MKETNPLLSSHHNIRRRPVDWTEPGLLVTRLSLISDPGCDWWDVSYCHGEIPGGEEVRVVLPFSQLPKRGFKAAIVSYARKDGLYAVKLGILDDINISILV